MIQAIYKSYHLQDIKATIIRWKLISNDKIKNLKTKDVIKIIYINSLSLLVCDMRAGHEHGLGIGTSMLSMTRADWTRTSMTRANWA
jgi:hypothetical protein